MSPNRFSLNVRYCLTWLNWTARDLGFAIWGDQGKKADSARRRIHRLIRGDVRVNLNDLDRIAAALSVPPAVLAYGSPEEMRQALGQKA